MKIKFNGQMYQVTPLITQDQLRVRIEELAEEINKDYASPENILVLVMLNGALVFAADLVRHFTFPTELETIRLKSYHGTSSGEVKLVGQIPPQIKGMRVLVVEDIVDSGKSLNFLLPLIKEAGAREIRVVTLLDKPDCHDEQSAPNYVGFSIGKHFVIGYGLDLDGYYRNLPYVGQMLPCES